MFARTERLLLRPIWPEDAAALHTAIADEAIVRNLAQAPWPYTADDAASFAALQHSDMLPNFMLMLRTDGAPQLIGSCGLGQHDGEAEIGYWIARPYWGQGFAAEAAKAVVSVAKALGHKKLSAGHMLDNPASGRVLRKVGFRPLGIVKPRYSAGRGENVPCALFELPLSASDGDSGNGVDPAPPMRMKPQQQMMQAA
jgi:RimJ/RimL family protein N-acetyltransferase